MYLYCICVVFVLYFYCICFVFVLYLFCISVVFVLYLCYICTVIVAGCTLPTLHHSWKWRSPATSPTQTSAHLAQPNPGTPLPHTPQPQLTSSGPPNQAIGPPGPVQAPEGPQTVVSGPPAACVCPYVGGQPPILNLLPLRYLLTFINFVTQPPKGRPLVYLHLAPILDL